MAELVLNVDFTPCERPRKKEAGSRKHQRFVRRRRELERRGALRPSQRPAPPARGKHRTRGGRGRGGRPEPEACPEKPKPLPAKPCPAASRPAPARDSKAKRSVVAAQPPVVAQDSKAKRSVVAAQPPAPARDSNAKPPARGGRSGSGTPHPPSSGPAPAKASSKGSPEAPSLPPPPSKLVAIDCEMVGTGPGGRTSSLARCSIVSYEGDVLYDRYVRPAAPIVDYRTRWSGIRRHHMLRALPFRTAQREILQLLAGKVVVGHSIHNDFKALQYFHPRALTRDTSRMPLLNRRGGFPEQLCVSLKRLTKQLLQRDIQVGSSGHSSVEDARATMELYKVVEAEWEQQLLLHPQQD